MSPDSRQPHLNLRLQAWLVVVVLILGIFAARLFYLQVIRHDHYKQLAAADQEKAYDIPADRGIIQAHSGNSVMPLVLNEKLYTLFADPTLVKDVNTESAQLSKITGGKAGAYLSLMQTKNSRYEVLATRLNDQQQSKIVALKLAGVGLQGHDYRVYPDGNLAAQLLGFVNDTGQGNYGIEQYLNKQLAGTDGRLKAVTDVNGVPLVAGHNNVDIQPTPGDSATLTIDIAMQKQLEQLLKVGLDRANSSSGGALIMDANSGAIKAMANWPTYDPSKYFQVTNPNVFENATVSSPLEVGSVMKIMTTATALNTGAIKANSSFFDPAIWHIDGQTIQDVAEDGGPQTRTVQDILQASLNTGATWMLMQMGGGKITQHARDELHSYFVNNFRFGQPTGIEQGYEQPGYVPDPDKGYALDLTYANMSFGQAMTATPLQMAGALAAAVNGGTYYKPYLVDSLTTPAGQTIATKPKVEETNVVSAKTSATIRGYMEYMIAHHSFSQPFSSRYSVGGKTGTPQIANPAGGYYTDRTNGTYIGYVGGSKPQYIIVVRVNQPHVNNFAGAGAAQPIFGDLAHMLINNFNIEPK